MINNFFFNCISKDPTNRIIVCGGVNDDYHQASPVVAILNTRKDQYEWTVPEINSEIGESPSLAYHTADMFQDYMVVAFGK